ncbi:MAG: T9SS type A sorting domain-containing protein [Candidatus Marinimicrobia bacterium]|nr:T9SS type A sorting domain-containing protein [Candidatus Neomarinimicrobiota bacterium]
MKSLQKYTMIILFCLMFPAVVFGTDPLRGKYDTNLLQPANPAERTLKAARPETFQPKINLATDILDSAIFINGGDYYKESYTFDENSRLTLIKTQYWYAPAASWVNLHQQIYTYDERGNVLSYLYQDWNTIFGQWKNSSLRTYAYNKYNSITEELSQNWDDDSESWQNYARYTSTYAQSGEKLTFLVERWDDGTSDWEPSSQSDFTYDASGNLASETYKHSNGTKWIYDHKYEFAYNKKNLILERIFSNYSILFWIPEEKILYTYDAYDNKSSYTSQIWSTTDNAWISDVKWEYTYDHSGNNLTSLNSTWDTTSDAWIPSFKVECEYDLRGNEISQLDQKWDPAVGVWINSDRGAFSYDSFDNMLTYFIEIWDPTTTQWQNYLNLNWNYNENGNLLHFTSEHWNISQWEPNSIFILPKLNGESLLGYDCEELDLYYAPVTKIDEEKTPGHYSLEQNYPNPFNPSTVLGYSLKNHGPVELTVFNALGEKVDEPVRQNQAPGHYAIIFDGSHLPSGLYFYTLKTRDFVKTRKMVLIK